MQLLDWITLMPVFLKCLGKLPASHLWYLAKQFRNEHPHHHNSRMYVNTFFPPYPSKPFDRFLDTVIERKRVPYSTYFAVTDKCPFNCPHCSYGLHKKGSLGTEQALNVIEQIKSLGTVTIGFTGGEPLLREDIVELVGSVGDQVATMMFTTGHRLNKELAGQLMGAELDCMMIGIESDDSAEHDKVRGVNGSFDEAIKAIGLSLEAGLYTAISTVGTKERIKNGQIQRLAQLAETYGVHEFRILEPIPTGSFYNQKDEVLSAAESKELTDFHKQWNRKNNGPAIYSFSYLESDEMFGCGAGFHHLFIDAIGNVCPCDLTPLSFGNVLEEPLEKIWIKMGEIFDLPRCGCLMKEICKKTSVLKDSQQLPLDSEKSFDLCRAVNNSDKLPKVYKNLFKDRKPISQPLNQQ
ncbi:MAG: radical SAM protein [Planctomycetes bacterium]|nr:radical SAM protein [Planctomycetota bacterium]MBL7106048.1 radical SAM protein [Phycisphaerae bacterium]